MSGRDAGPGAPEETPRGTGSGEASAGGEPGPGERGPSALPSHAPPPGLLVVTAIVLAGAAGFAGRFRETVWMGVLLVCTGVGFGMVAGLALRIFCRGPWSEALTGAGGRYLIFLGGVLFTAAEAYAFGVALAQGAPPVTAAFLVPPVAVAGLALRSAAGRVRFAPEPAGRGTDEADRDA